MSGMWLNYPLCGGLQFSYDVSAMPEFSIVPNASVVPGVLVVVKVGASGFVLLSISKYDYSVRLAALAALG